MPEGDGLVPPGGTLGKLEKIIAGPPQQQPEAMNDLVSRIDAAVNACRALGQEARAIEETTVVFADHIEKLLREFHENISDRLREIAKAIGRLGKRGNTPPAS